MDEKPLPPNWEKRVDQRTGWPYFVDHANQRTQWEDPRQQAAAQQTHSTNAGLGEPTNIPIHVQTGQENRSASHSPSPLERDRSPIAPGTNSTNNPRGGGNRNIHRSAPPQVTTNEVNNPVNSALQTIGNIKKDAETYHSKIEAFTNVKESKDYKYLEEMMERNLCKLDNIDANGNENIRTNRKEVVKYIQQCLDQLELKAFANETDITTSESG